MFAILVYKNYIFIVGGDNGMIDHLLDVVFGKSKITKPVFIKEFSKENRQLELLEIESSVKDKKE